jgi:hypothetical protein
MNGPIIERILREEAQADDQIVYDGYSKRQLDAAFALVANAENWKLGIDAVINDSPANRRLVNSAMIFMAGSPAEFIGMPGGKVRVLGDGYYSRIGA